jgi:F-type H+-transporting ATPase subunit b
MELVMEYLTETIFWYTVGVIVCLFLIVKYAGKPIVGAIDAEIEKIRHELETAKALRVEAEAKLKQVEVQQQEAMNEAEEIVARARLEATRIHAEAAEELKRNLARQERRAEELIQKAQDEALAEVRAKIVDWAMEAARKNLTEHPNAAAEQKWVDEAIAAAPRLVEKKSA